MISEEGGSEGELLRKSQKEGAQRGSCSEKPAWGGREGCSEGAWKAVPVPRLLWALAVEGRVGVASLPLSFHAEPSAMDPADAQQASPP